MVALTVERFEERLDEELGGDAADVEVAIAGTPEFNPSIPDADYMLAQIDKAERECAEKESAYLLLKGEMTDAKKDYESSVDRLRGLIRSGRNDGNRPLLDACEKNGVWRNAAVADWFSDKRILKAFDESKMSTMGQLSDYLKDYEAGSIKGIGPNAVEVITATFEEFWKRYPQE